MSYFDPYGLYTTTKKRATRSGQINQKKPVDPHFALTGADLTRAMNVMKAFNYYFTKNPPRVVFIPFSFNVYNSTFVNSLSLNIQSMFSQLHDYVRAVMIDQYSDIFDINYSNFIYKLMFNSFSGVFYEDGSVSGDVEFTLYNRFTYTSHIASGADVLTATFYPLNFTKYAVLYTSDYHSDPYSFTEQNSTIDSNYPGVLQSYNFNNDSAIFNYFKDTNPTVNPFPSTNVVTISTPNVIKADRIVGQFTLNIFLNYFFFIFFFLILDCFSCNTPPGGQPF